MVDDTKNFERNKPIIQQFQDDLVVVVDKYRDEGITIGEVIGCFELTKIDLWSEFVEAQDNLNEGFNNV